MKKLLFVLVAVIGLGIGANAIPNGKYCSDNSYVKVSGQHIYLFVDGYSAGSFKVQEEQEDGSFTFTDSGGKVHSGSWYKQDGKVYLKMGNRKLQKCD